MQGGGRHDETDDSFGFFYRVVVAGGLSLLVWIGVASTLQAANMVHEFYLPMPEDQVRSTFTALETGVGTTIDSVFSIVITGPGTILHYDQWEDGYEIDINNPIQSSTQIWGDGNNANGKPPGYANDSLSFPAGTVLTLRNIVPYPRASSTNLFFDARDRLAGSKALVVSRTAWAPTPGTVLAGAVEVTATIDYGTNYVCPVGQDVTASAMFEYVGLFVMAELNGTVVTIDSDGPGVGAPFTVPLNRGESYLVNGGIRKGASVTATKPVQAHLVTGDIGARYETDWFTLYPVEQWDSRYVTPVGTAANGNACYVFVYNPNTNAITVNYTTRTGSGSFPVGTNAVYQYLMPQNSGAVLNTTNGARFFAISTVGANPAANNVYDWGFTLLPSSYMTTEAVVGWGPGSGDLSANGSPVWVTPVAATRVYVDHNGDRLGPKTDPAGNKYDVDFDLAALQSQTIYDTDKDQTAMRLYTLNGIAISTAWGEDPAVAAAGNPYLDVGTTVLPFPVPVLKKTSRLYTDNSPTGISTNDILEYTITVDNKGLLPLGNTVVIDQLPASIAYVTNTMTYNGLPISDNVPTNTAFPLDETGYTIPIILRGGTSAFTFRVRIVGFGSIINSGFSGQLSVSNEVVVPPPAGMHSNTIVFVDAATNGTAVYTAGDGVYVKLTDPGVNQSTTTVETVTVYVTDTVTGDVEPVVLTETGPNTGVFVSATPIPTSLSGGLGAQDGTLHVNAGDGLSVTFTDPLFGDTTTASASVIAPTLSKVLYLSDPTQALDRIDPVATGDNMPTQTVVLGSVGGTTVTNTIGAQSTAFGRFPIDSGTGFSDNYTVGTGSNQLMLVSLALKKSSVDGPGSSKYVNVLAATYNAQSLTLVTNRMTAAETAVVYIWAMTNPPSGSHTLAFTVEQKGSSLGIAAYGVTTLTNVDLTNFLGAVNSAAGNGTTSSVSVASSFGDLAYDAVAVGASVTLTTGAGQGNLWSLAATNTAATPDIFVTGGSSTKTGGSSVTNTWSWSGAQDWAAAALSIKPTKTTMAAGGTYSAVFTQTPTFAMPFNMVSGGVIRVTNFVTVVSGTMPPNPSINAILSCGGTNFLTLTNASYSSTASNIVWSGSLTNAFAALTNQAISLTVTTLQAGVTFRIDYDSSDKASQIRLPTTNVIAIASLGVYDAAYPGGSNIAGAANGAILYVRATVTDPFGNYDISQLNLSIDGPGTSADVSVTLSNAQVVASNAYSKTYQYPWNTTSVQGSYAGHSPVFRRLKKRKPIGQWKAGQNQAAWGDSDRDA